MPLATRNCTFISVEMSNGQMRDDIRLATGCGRVELVNRYGGNLIRVEDIMVKIREIA
jgi:2-oxoisovalerate ferredoxin oxidoreductase alpha subunit